MSSQTRKVVNRVIGSEVDTLQRESFSYFEHEVNAVNGLVIDKTAQNSPASIAATGFALAAYPVGVERGFISRAVASSVRWRRCVSS